MQTSDLELVIQCARILAEAQFDPQERKRIQDSCARLEQLLVPAKRFTLVVDNTSQEEDHPSNV